MEDYQKRVVEEKTELDVRNVALTGFLYSNKSIPITTEERWPLKRQLFLMTELSQVLADRVSHFA